MDLTQIITIIANYGFPVICCIILFHSQKTELKELHDAITNNTRVMEKILEHVREGENKQ